MIFWGPTVPIWLSAANIAAGIVGLLVLLAIPRHARLGKRGKNDATITELIRYNWPRTLSISIQAFITFLMLGHVFGSA